MRTAVVALSLAILITRAQPGEAWDFDGDDPVTDPPVADVPVADWAPEPTPVAPPEGIYLVTDTYAGDSVTHSGPVTTYTTETVHEITGSYARVLESVGTGGASGFDGAAFNGRAALTDGRSVAGTYYENFILTGDGFVPVSVVFFQDDSEIARASAPLPAAPPAASEAPAVPLLSPTAAIQPSRGDAPVIGYVTPTIEDRDRVPGPATPTTPSAALVLPDRSIEVLRGRRISILFSSGDVRAWRALSTEGVVLGPLSGSAAQPFVIRWDRLAPRDASWIARFLLDYADGTSHELVIRVVVRAPGLVE